MAGGRLTPEYMDGILEKMDVAVLRVDQNRHRMVKLQSAEVALLTQIEAARDLMMDLLKAESSTGNRDLLRLIFGGDCARVAHVKATVEAMEFSDMYADDQRISSCLRACESVERVLSDLGCLAALKRATEKQKRALLARRRTSLTEEDVGILARLMQQVDEAAAEADAVAAEEAEAEAAAGDLTPTAAAGAASPRSPTCVSPVSGGQGAATTPMSATPTSGGPSPARQGALSTPMSGSPKSPAQEDAPEEEGAAAVTVETAEPAAEEEPEEAGNEAEVVAGSAPPKARAKKLRPKDPNRRPRTRPAIDEELVAKILAAPTFADLDVLEPSREEKTLSWMVWMVQRAHMDDPTLTRVDFTNMRMPTGREEQRIAPKLVQAMATNTHISALLLASSNLQGTEGSALGSALKSNKKLKELNIDSNFLGGRDLEHLAEGIAECPTLEQVRCNNQHPGPAGRSAVDAFVHAVKANSSILKLGLSTEDPNSANQLNQAIMHNTELARMKRKDNAAAVRTAVRAKAKA